MRVFVVIAFLICSSTLFAQTLTINNNGTYTSSGDATYTSTSFGNNPTLQIVSDHVVTIDADLVVNNGMTVEIAIDATLIITGTLTANNNIDFQIDGSLVVGAVTLNNNAVLSVSGSGVIDIQGDFRTGTGADITVSGDMTIDGNVDVGGGTITVDAGGTLTIDGTYSGPTIGGTGTTVVVCDQTYTWTGAVDNDWNTAGNWSCNLVPDATKDVIIAASGVTSFPEVDASTGGVCKHLTIESGASLTLLTNATLELVGNYTNDGTFSAASGSKVIFSGSQSQAIGGVSRTTFKNIELNNTFVGTYQLELTKEINVAGELTLTQGKINMTSNYIDLESTGEIIGENNSNYIYSENPLAYIVATQTVNTASVEFNPGQLGIAITPSVGKPLGDIEIKRSHSRVLNASGLAESAARYYSVKAVGGGSVNNNGSLNAELSISYLSHEIAGLNQDNLSIYRQPNLDEDVWLEYGGSVNTSTQKVVYQGWDSFSGITIGEFGTTLPITFLGMEATCNSAGGVDLVWETGSELNNSHFEIQRSRNGYDWEVLAIVQAVGNATTTSTYNYTDQSAGVNFEGYYRLKQVDFDGLETILSPVSVFCEGQIEDDFQLYPNPTNGPLNIRISRTHYLSASSTVVIIDGYGRIVKNYPVEVKQGNNLIALNVSDLKAGIYMVRLQNESYTTAKRLLVD